LVIGISMPLSAMEIAQREHAAFSAARVAFEDRAVSG
jgi:hypothetical protein